MDLGKLSIGIGVTLLLGGGAFVINNLRSDDARVDTKWRAEVNKELASLRARPMPTITRRVERIVREVPGAPPPPAPREEDAPQEQQVLSPDAAREQFVARGTEKLAALADEREIALLDQDRDPDWSADASQWLEAAFADERLTGSSIEEIDCRTTLCRIIIRHESPTSQKSFLPALAELTPQLPEFGVQAQPASDGVLRTTVFAAREGHNLPHLSDG